MTILEQLKEDIEDMLTNRQDYLINNSRLSIHGATIAERKRGSQSEKKNNVEIELLYEILDKVRGAVVLEKMS